MDNIGSLWIAFVLGALLFLQPSHDVPSIAQSLQQIAANYAKGMR